MDHAIAAAAANNQGIVTRDRLTEIGTSEREVDQLLRAGLLVAVRRGVYTTRELWDSWDEFHDRPMARIRAAHLSIDIPHVFSHESAAVALGLPLLDSRHSVPHITRPDKRATKMYGGTLHHGAAYDDDDVVEVDGLPVLGMARTAIDLARRPGGYRPGLIAADGALRRGVAREDLRAVLDRMQGWPFTRMARRVVRDADAGAENASETLARELVLEAGLGPDVETQFPIPHRGGTYWGDVRVGRHIIEFDGRIKYKSEADGGLADRELEQILWEERGRHRDICHEGLGISRLVYADFWGEARERAKQRLRETDAEIRERLGTELPPHLAEYAERMRGRRTPRAS